MFYKSLFSDNFISKYGLSIERTS